MDSAAIGAGIAVVSCGFAALGIGIAAGRGSEAIARQPEKAKEIRALAFLGMVLSESCAIYGLLIAILLFSRV